MAKAAKTAPKTRSLSVSNETYDKVQAVRQKMLDAGPCKTCGHCPESIPLKQAAEEIVQLGLEAWADQEGESDEEE